MSSLALPPEESFFMQHYLGNVARLALAIDYDGNGYRSMLPMAMEEPALMNAMLAVAASHHGRWQNTTETVSRKYLRAAIKGLSDRLSRPELVSSPVTLAAMLCLVSFEVFSGSIRWRAHYDAIRGWVHSRGDCSDLDPFLKTWVCMLDTQCALNEGSPAMAELESWMEGHDNSIDAFFGCSAKLPKLMWAAAELCAESRNGHPATEEVRRRADALQEKIRATAMSPESDPAVGILCRSTRHPYAATVDLDKENLRQRMVATAEIFRHASHIFVYRIVHGPEEPLTDQMQESLQKALSLLTFVPDAIGPGANLGWCLVVIGAELDVEDQRDYIRSRWEGMHLLGMYNSKSGERILEEVWNHRDLVSHGQAVPERWQDIMQNIGQTQILV
ncbi:hypothetical protein GQ53DRAFT_821134 [Thozetella sp. PMI_491]|nr:hypothetical protein GQ53DRAFT_821134 [Thozetella sp. PMI_491]